MITHTIDLCHDDVIKWKHCPRYWSFVQGIHRSPVNSPQKGQWRGALLFSLICAWINGWINNGEASDLRRHHAHYDVPVMSHPKLNHDRVRVTNLKKWQKFKIWHFAKKKLHTTHLLDTICKYEMNWVWLVLYCGNYRVEMILSTDGQTDGYGETSIPSSNFVEQGIYLYTSVPSQLLMIKA